MSARKWHSGPPPHVGWWNASPFHYEDMWRWWDGRKWSTWVGRDASISEAAHEARFRSAFPVSAMSWSDYWPENARVPRIDPRKAK